MKLQKPDVQKQIFQQTINTQKIYYSYTNKSQATLSMLKNQRLLIFNSKTGLLYYINEPKSLPFVTDLPKPKNDAADVSISVAKNPPGTNQMVVQFGMKNQKGEVTSMEWNFVFQNKALAAAWVKVIQQYKDRKMTEIMGVNQSKTINKQQDTKQNPQSSNAFIHDTIGYGVMEAPKNRTSVTPPAISPEKKEQPPKIVVKLPEQRNEIPPTIPKPNTTTNNTVANNNITSTMPPPITTPSTINTPNVKPTVITPPNSLEGSINNRTPLPTIQPITNYNNAQQNPNSLENSRQLSPEARRSRITNEPAESKLTFRDELQSIVSRNRNYNQPESRLTIDNENLSKKKGSTSCNPQNDWNLKFLRNQSEEVLIDFENYAVKSFFSILKEDNNSDQAIRVYIKPQSMVIVTDARSVQAKKIKSEFRNYHFIMQSCKDHFIVGVPLACLIEFEGLVALVKSLIPDTAPRLQLTQELMLDLKDLQRYTRIKNNVLKKATLYDLSQIYESTGKRLVYINQLIEYLPVHIDESFTGGSLRPEHMLDNVDQFMAGGMAHDANRQDMKALNDTLDVVRKNVSKLAAELSTQDVTFANGLELKDIMHSRGINLKYLPSLYQQTQHKQMKKYIHSFMVAKIAKDNILQNLSQTRNDSSSPTLIKETVERSIKLLIQGNSNLSNELWKELAVNFRKQYSIPMSNHDISGPFFLNSLMKIIPGSYDLGRINQKKTFFKDDGIVGKGFVVEMLPKVKSYYRFTTTMTEKVMAICKGEKLEDNFILMVEEFQLETKQVPRRLELSRADQSLKEYLTFFVGPPQFEPQEFPHLNLYQTVLSQPPTSSSLAITRNYLTSCLYHQRYPQFKSTLEQTLKLIDYWFDPGHVFHCQFYQALSQYYQETGSIEDSVNFIKESLAVCIRSGGVAGKRTGEKYMVLGEKELKAGRLTSSLDSFLKSKNNMQAHSNPTIKYPIVLTKLASLYLSQSDFPSCVQYSKLAVQKFQQLQTKRPSNLPKGYYDQYSIRALEVMSRAFEVQSKKNDLYKMAQLASTKYNKTANPRVFVQLTKMCLTATILKHSAEKCQVFQSLVEKLLLPSQTDPIPDQEDSLNELMSLALQFNVMERFMFKFQNLERIVADINSRRALASDSKEFVNIVRYIVGLVGDDYVSGLIQEKQVE